MIGIFDSGEGGLSVFREIYRLLPEEKYVFYSDNANCPYGEKSVDFIIQRSKEITEILLDKGCNIIVIACNTATSAAIKELREQYPVKFIGMEPAVKPAAEYTKTGVVGVLATSGTLKGAKYLNNKNLLSPEIKVVEAVGKGWVELVEKGLLEGEEAERVVEESIRPILDANADSIVLGCTHYPFLANTIRKIAGNNIRLIDPAPAAARHLVYVMVQEKLLNEKQAAKALSLAVKVAEAEEKGESPDNSVFSGKPNIELLCSGNYEALERVFNTIFINH